MSSGEVSSLTRTTFSLFAPISFALSAVKQILPLAAPGDAGSASPITVAFFTESALKVGCKSASSCFGSSIKSAVFSSIMPSATRSTAILRAAFAVLFPFLV